MSNTIAPASVRVPTFLPTDAEAKKVDEKKADALNSDVNVNVTDGAVEITTSAATVSVQIPPDAIKA